MSIDTTAEVAHRGARRRFSSVFTGVVVAAVLLLPSAVGQVFGHDTGSTSHLWDHIKAMREPGTINADTNPLHWTKLKGVPTGFADGIDGAGAGFGLNEVWGTLWVDPTEVQKRVTTSCPAGQAIKSINQDGTAVCRNVNQALSTTDDDTGIICNSWCTEGSLALSAGTWVITAKIGVRQADLNEDILRAYCRLHAESVVDEASMDVVGDLLPYVTLPMQIVATVPAGSGAYLDCRDYDVGNAMGFALSIIAIRVGG